MATPCRVSVTGCAGVGGGLCALASAAAARVIVNTREIILPRIIEKWAGPRPAAASQAARPVFNNLPPIMDTIWFRERVAYSSWSKLSKRSEERRDVEE